MPTLSVIISDQARAEGIAVAPTTTTSHPVYYLTHLSQEQKKRQGLPLKPEDFEIQGDTRSWWVTTWEHLLVFIWLVLIFGIRCISFQDSDPQCCDSPVQDRSHCLHRELLQNQHPASAQQGSIHLEGRIFCGCSDQSYRPALHVRKEGVLQIYTHIGESKEKMGGKEVKIMAISDRTRYQE